MISTTHIAPQGVGAAVGPPEAERFVFVPGLLRGIGLMEALRIQGAAEREFPFYFYVLLQTASSLGFGIQWCFGISHATMGGDMSLFVWLGPVAWHAFRLYDAARARRSSYLYFDGCELVCLVRGKVRCYIVEQASAANFHLGYDGRVVGIELKFGDTPGTYIEGLTRMEDFAAKVTNMLPEGVGRSIAPIPLDARPGILAVVILIFMLHLLSPWRSLIFFLLLVAGLVAYYWTQSFFPKRAED